jgi:hypothetical protein
MKKIYILIFILGSLIFTLNSCKIDNFPEPDAQVYGAILDSLGGGLVETDITSSTGSVISVYELGKYEANPLRRTWLIKQNGEYRNNLVYANDYRFEFSSCNFFPKIEPPMTIRPGENKVDFTVVPYIRIKNLSITYDPATNKVNATFNLEPGRNSVRLSRLRLYSYTDMYVGENVKKSLAAAGTGTPLSSGVPQLSYTNAVINPATVYTLSIDLAANQSTDRNGFGVHRNYYFRVGALATVSSSISVGTIRYNYAPYVVIPL